MAALLPASFINWMLTLLPAACWALLAVMPRRIILRLTSGMFHCLFAGVRHIMPTGIAWYSARLHIPPVNTVFVQAPAQFDTRRVRRSW